LLLASAVAVGDSASERAWYPYYMLSSSCARVLA